MWFHGFAHLRIRSKLILIYSLLFITIISACSILIYFQVRSTIEKRLDFELETTTSLILELVKTSANVSLKNHLRATVENNLDLIQIIYQKLEKGELSKSEAQARVKEILASHVIGETGYFYAINSQGIPVIHPRPEIIGQSFYHFEFVKEMISKKEGYMEYLWRNPDEMDMHLKAQYYVYFEPWDWIIAATSYRSEFADLVNIDDFKEKLLSLKLGESGYPVIFKSNADIVLHPHFTGNLFKDNQEDVPQFIETILTKKNGRVEYFWKNPGDEQDRKKIALFSYLPELDWYVVSSVYTDEFFVSLTVIGNTFLVITLLFIFLTVLISIHLGGTISRPLEQLTTQLNSRSPGRKIHRDRFEVRGSAEMIELSSGLNHFLEALDQEEINRQKAEEALKENEEKLAGVFNSTFYFIFLLDKEGALRTANQTALDHIGVPLEDVVGSSFITSPWWKKFDAAEQLDEALQTCLAEGMIHLHLQAGESNKIESAFDISMKTIVDQEGNVIDIMVEASDITRKVAMETALKNSEELHRAILETSPNPVVQFGEAGVVEFINPSFTRVFGWTPEEVIGETLLNGDIPFVPDDLKNETMKSIIAMNENNQPILSIQTHRYTKSGELLNININGAIFNDKDGNPIGLVSNFTDITLLKKAEMDLLETRNYIRDIIDSMPSMLIGVDPQGLITQWNSEAEKLTKLEIQEALDRSIFDLLPEVANEIGIKKSSTAVIPAVIEKSRVPIKLAGEELIVDITVFPLVREKQVGLGIRIDDIGQRIEMEEAMIQSDKMLSIGGLAAGMAHEINNPLAVILQTTQVMKNRMDSGKERNLQIAAKHGIELDKMEQYLEERGIPEMMAAIMDSGKRAAKIVQNMLSFARKSDTTKTICQIESIMDNTIELITNDFDLKKQYDFRSVEVIKDYGSITPPVRCEESKIQQVFLNIIQNGVHAMVDYSVSQGIEITPRFVIRIRNEADEVIIEIEDNGPGMEDEVRKRIFEPFYTTKEVGTGTGLGLSVSYFIIVEHHNGSMNVESEPGKGSRFVITLPCR